MSAETPGVATETDWDQRAADMLDWMDPRLRKAVADRARAAIVEQVEGLLHAAAKVDVGGFDQAQGAIRILTWLHKQVAVLAAEPAGHPTTDADLLDVLTAIVREELRPKATDDVISTTVTWVDARDLAQRLIKRGVVLTGDPVAAEPAGEQGTDWRGHLNAIRRQLVGTPPNVDSIDAAIGYALNDCEAAIDAALAASRGRDDYLASQGEGGVTG